MPCGNGVKSERVGSLQQSIKLDVAVALYARVRSKPSLMMSHIRGDNFFVELFAEVEHMMLYTKVVADTAGIVHIRYRTATRVGCSAPELHRHAYHLVARLGK